jgi:adenylylsulfate kinase
MMKSGVVVWLTGLPSAGKSTLAERLKAAFDTRGVHSCVLDGDAVRSSLSPTPGYSAAEREQFYETLARLAALLASQGLIVLVAATAHRRSFRERARQLSPAFFELWVDTPLSECVKRDTKGLYAASRSGAASTVPGGKEAYEPPLSPDYTARGTLDSAEFEHLVSELTGARSGESPASARPSSG